MTTRFDGEGDFSNPADRDRFAACVLDGRNPDQLRSSDLQWFIVMDDFDDDTFYIENGVIMVSVAIYEKFQAYEHARVMAN